MITNKNISEEQINMLDWWFWRRVVERNPVKALPRRKFMLRYCYIAIQFTHRDNSLVKVQADSKFLVVNNLNVFSVFA